MMVPKLRFNHFDKTWSSEKFEDVFSFKNGLNASKEMYGTGIKFINVLDIIKNDKITYDVIQESVQATNEQISNYEVKKGDILFQRSSETREEVGQANIYIGSETVLFGGFVIRARPLVKMNSVFLNFQLKTDLLRKDITQRSGGSTRYNIGQESLGKITGFFPEIEEQNQIANFLGSVDEKITLMNKQYDLLCQYKKGMMQKIFSQELRFKDENGEEFPEWDYDEVSALVSNKSKKYNPLSGINYPCIELDCISQESGQLLTTVDSLQQQSIKNIFREGDVLFGKLRPYLRKYILATFDGVCSSEIWVLKGILMHNAYLYQFVQTEFFINLANKSTGSKMPRADWDTISSTFIFYPCLEEQNKIADFLCAIDDKITTKKTELDKLKTWKQGLLQQMFV